MKILLLIFILININAFENRQSMMDSISKHAIKIGTGQNKVYSFIDPLCEKSQAFIQLITSRVDLQKESTYYIFLYPLQRYASEFLIIHIYQSKNQLETLKEVMVYEDYDVNEQKITNKTKQILYDVKIIAQKINIQSRPYLLLFDKGSKYCKVSEGTAPCLEENDFD